MENLITDIVLQETSGQFRNFCRMASVDFDYLLSLIISKISSNYYYFCSFLKFPKVTSVIYIV